jgi:hypothetical protein
MRETPGWAGWTAAGRGNDSRPMQSLANRMLLHARRGMRVHVALALAAVFTAAPADAFEWQIDITPAGELFPALQLSQARRAATAGDGDGLVSVHVRGSDIPDDLRVRIDTPGLREPGVAVATGARSAAALELRPRLDWDLEQLRRLGSARRQLLQVTLEAAGRPADVRRVEVRVHPLDDALYYVREGRDRVDLGWAFAGYVNPHDPVVEDVLASARAIEPGFDTDTAAGDATAAELRRAGAVWAALEQRGLRYANDDPALSRGPVVWSQRVRLLGDVWRDRRANCLDSSVLIASVLERLGMRAFLVLVPGHAFVGFRGAEPAGDVQYLETTLLGAPAAGPATVAQKATVNFAAARSGGRARWRKIAAKIDGRHGPAYALVDISAARAYGIMPFADAGGAGRNPPDATPAPAGSSRKSGSP